MRVFIFLLISWVAADNTEFINSLLNAPRVLAHNFVYNVGQMSYELLVGPPESVVIHPKSQFYKHDCTLCDYPVEDPFEVCNYVGVNSILTVPLVLLVHSYPITKRVVTYLVSTVVSKRFLFALEALTRCTVSMTQEEAKASLWHPECIMATHALHCARTQSPWSIGIYSIALIVTIFAIVCTCLWQWCC